MKNVVFLDLLIVFVHFDGICFPENIFYIFPCLAHHKRIDKNVFYHKQIVLILKVTTKPKKQDIFPKHVFWKITNKSFFSKTFLSKQKQTERNWMRNENENIM